MMKSAFSCNGHLIPGLRLRLRFVPLLYSTSTSSSTSTCTSPINSGNNSSFSDFLVNSLGFENSHSITVTAKLTRWRRSKDMNDLTSPNIENAHSVVHFFEQLGFHHPQIKTLVVSEPRVLLSSVDNCLKPKIMLLKDLCVSDSDLRRIILTNNRVLRIRLEPVIDAFRTVMGSNDNVVACLKRRSYLGAYAHLLPNVELFHDFCGVPIENIRKYVQLCPNVFLKRPDLFREVVDKVEPKLGIPRHSSMFVYGLQLLVCHHEDRLQDRSAVFKSFGWTQCQLAGLITRNPCCLNSSAAGIRQKLDFLMNHMGCTPDYLMTRVSLFTYSVKKRLMPRYRVLQILKEKGKSNCSLESAFGLTEPVFVKRFVLPFEEVHDVYAQLTGSAVGSLNVG